MEIVIKINKIDGGFFNLNCLIKLNRERWVGNVCVKFFLYK